MTDETIQSSDVAQAAEVPVTVNVQLAVMQTVRKTNPVNGEVEEIEVDSTCLQAHLDAGWKLVVA